MSSSNESFIKTPRVRPLLNIGCLFDIPTGRYITGAHGESILNGGLSHLTGLGGRGNTYKSTMAHYMMLTILDRYTHSKSVFYDTEISLTMDRLEQLAVKTENLHLLDFDVIDDRLILSDKVSMNGNEFFDILKKQLVKQGKDKNALLTTPFPDKVNGGMIKSLAPFLVEVDSLSQMEFSVVEAMYDKNQVGDSSLNTEALKSAAAKTQMLVQLPTLTGKNGGYMIMTAHLGDDTIIDKYSASKKKLAFLKGDVKFKRIPENFTFLSNNFWLCYSATVLVNQADKTAEYPRANDSKLKGDTDLMCVTIQNLRGKTGPTGMPIEIIVSQIDGVLVGLTQFNYIKKSDRYGIGGHDKSYFIELLPDVNLRRTTVRGVIDEDAKLRRALEITSEMCQIKNLWPTKRPELLCTPAELYEGIKERGYDWDVILDKTRGYWVFEEDEQNMDKMFLSTMDLLKMKLGEYHPYWWDDFMKKKGKEK